MSLPFNEPTGTGTAPYKGIVQTYEKEAGFNLGDISGDATALKLLAADVNQALDDFFAIALPASGTWQFDDSNQTSYPILTASLVQGQRDYPFTTDLDGNLILDIYKVMILPSATATQYVEVFPIDAQSDRYNNIQANVVTQGVPLFYDKTADAIFFDPIPSYSVSAGIKVYINREASYFTYSDTTKKPGVPGLFHRYFAIKPAMEYARRKGLTSYAGLAKEVLDLEGDPERGVIGRIARYFGARERDKRKIMTGAPARGVRSNTAI